MMDAYTDLRMLRDSQHPLGVTCQRCNLGALLDYGELISRHGQMRKIAAIRFKCSKCRGRKIEFRLFWRRSEMHRFMRE
jgi:hypothetical protein